jgi:hypothetical protein
MHLVLYLPTMPHPVPPLRLAAPTHFSLYLTLLCVTIQSQRRAFNISLQQPHNPYDRPTIRRFFYLRETLGNKIKMNPVESIIEK